LKTTQSGYSLIELVICVGLLTAVFSAVVSVINVFAGRYASDLLTDRTEKAAARIETEYGAAMKSAMSFAIYPDQATWLVNPGNSIVSGNFVLITQTSGRQIAFEEANGNINIINDPANAHEVLQCLSSATLTGSNAFAFQNNGVPTLAWQVALPAEKLTFNACAQPLYMQ